MSNIKYLLPQIDELTTTDVLALQEKKTIFPFNLSAKNIKVSADMSLAEKYPFSIETSSGFTYQIVKDGKKIADIQLSNETGLEVKGDAKYEKLLKVFFMDETKTLYRNLINQLTKLGNNQLFILCLGMKAQSLVKGDVTTVSMIKAPMLKLITGDQWIQLVIQVIKDISWGFFDKADRDVIAANFERDLREVVDVELKLLGCNIPALEKAVKHELKQISSSTIDIAPDVQPNPDPTEQLKVIQEVNDTPTEPFITEQELKDLNYESLLEVIKEKSITVYEYASQKLKAKPQIISYLKKKGWVKANEPEQPQSVEVKTEPVEDQATEPTETTEQATEQQ